MTLYASYHDRNIRLILKSPAANALSPHLRLLAQAVWQVRTTRSAHERCLAALPAYVTSEMEVNLATFHGSSIRKHLQVCHRCANVYAELLDAAILDTQWHIPLPSLSQPDLSFLETPNDRIQ